MKSRNRATIKVPCENCGMPTGDFITKDFGVACIVCKEEIPIEEYDKYNDLCYACFFKYTEVNDDKV